MHEVDRFTGRPNSRALRPATAIPDGLVCVYAYLGLSTIANRSRSAGMTVHRRPEYPQDYIDKFLPTLEQRLSLAGARLASLLNRVLQ